MKHRILIALLVLVVMLITGIIIAQFSRTSNQSLSREEIKVTNNMGFPIWQQYMIKGQHAEAFNVLSKELRQARQEGDATKEFRFLYDLGSYSQELSLFKEGIVYFDNAFEVAGNNNWPLKAAVAGMESSVCLLYLRRIDEALDILEASMEVFDQYNLDGLRAVCFCKMSWGYSELLDYEQAVACMDDALAAYKKQDDIQNLPMLYLRLAETHRRFHYPKQAIQVLKEGLKIADQAHHDEFRVVFQTELGSLYLRREKFKEAKKYLDLAEQGVKKLEEWGLMSGRYLSWLRLFKISYLLETRDYSRAKAVLERYKPDTYFDSDDYEAYNYQMAQVLRGLGRHKQASDYLIKAVSTIEERRWERIGDMATFYDHRKSRAALPYKLLISSLAKRVLAGEKQDENLASYGNNMANSTFYFAESLKARALLDIMAGKRKYDDADSKLPPALKAKEEELLKRYKREASALKSVIKKDRKLYWRIKKRKDNAFKGFHAFIKDLQLSHPLYAFTRYPNPIRAESLPLKANEVLLEYAFLFDELYIFLVKKGVPVRIVKAAREAKEIKQLTKEFCSPFRRDTVSGELPYNLFSVKRGKVLYDLLLAPVLKEVKASDSLLIVPDGILAMLPFEILVIEPGKNYAETVFVADRREISYYQSASIMTVLRNLKQKRASHPRLMLAVGNPVYSKKDPRYKAFQEGRRLHFSSIDLSRNNDKYTFTARTTRREWGDSTSLTFSPLPESQTEILNISRVLNLNPSGSDILLNMDANETRFRQAPLTEYRYLHFATHADLPGNVMGINEPFILLGQVENKDPDDGFLTISEVADLKLDADMVVLSACVTGLGEVREVEGVANFAYAFHSAGARSVVVSLWEVASQQAVAFMTLFYKQLQQGENRAAALSFARKAIRKTNPNPFFWAPFIIHGEKE